MWCLADLTSILWEQDCKRAFFQNSCWIVFFGEGWNSPVVNPFMIPRLVLLVLQLNERWIASFRDMTDRLCSALELK